MSDYPWGLNRLLQAPPLFNNSCEVWGSNLGLYAKETYTKA